MSRTMHVLMLLMKLAMMCTALCIAMETLMMLFVYSIKVKPRPVKAVKCTVKIERKASRKLSTLSAVKEIIIVIVEEGIRTENVVKVGTVSGTIK